VTSDGHVAPGVRRIALPLPLALRSVNVYLIEGDGGWSIVDSGMHTPEAEAELRSGLVAAGIAMAELRTAFITHLHPDHLGMAGTLRDAGAKLLMHGPEIARAHEVWAADHRQINATYELFERHGMPRDVDEGMRAGWVAMGERVDPFEPIHPVANGEVLDLGGRALTVIWTPGHTDHHAVLFEESSGTLISGDHVLPRITSNVGVYPGGRPDPLGDFLGALEQMKTLNVKRVLPAHGEPFDDCAGRVDEILAHHVTRLDQTLNGVGGGGRNAYEICRILFPVLRSPHEERFALAETLAHLVYLELRGRLRQVEGKPIKWSVV
jgi:glyoxylase-like metal-dependent hydrolase (beta-lactamase superfamily II)